jgi:lysophospholipase L1-like esterase
MKTLLKFLVIAAVFLLVAMGDSSSFTIHIVGDSTVCTYKDNVYPQTGWGQIFSSFFDGSRVRVNNAAIGGRSSKTFIQEGRLEELRKNFQKGDFLLVQFGHNDRYFGNSSRQVPFDSLAYWLQQYVDAAKSAGVTPIFVTPMNMNMGHEGRNIFTEYNVVGKMLELAKSNHIPYVNLNSKSYNAYSINWNPAYVSRYQFKYYYPNEYPSKPEGDVSDGTTHFQESGSISHCQWIAEELENALNEDYLSSEAKSSLMELVSALKPRYDFTVKANISNGSGLITHNQNLPGGAPLTLHVSPSSFNKKFQGWYDDDCNLLTSDSNYYGHNTLYRAATYTAVFEGGAACSKTAHGEEVIPSSNSNAPESSSSSTVAVIDPKLCTEENADSEWPSVIEIYEPESGNGSSMDNHEGFTGVGFFDFVNELGSKAVFNVTSDQSAEGARVMVRYSNGSTTARSMKITVDNFTYDVDFPPTQSWDAWDTAYIENVWVDALDFKLTLESTSDNGGPNIDMIAFDMTGVYRTGCKSDGGVASLRKTIVGSRVNAAPVKSGIFDALGRRIPGSETTHRRLPRLRIFSR